MADVIPLIAVFALWIPIAAGIAWLFERRRANIYRR
jgi:hypothetical protein